MSEEETVGVPQREPGPLPPYVGPYRALERIGRGGMGDVYLCEQVQPIRRRVAIKVLRRGMDSARIVERFKAERQMLALMAHSNIARMLDAGETERGLPYVVMEYVPGVALATYCRERRVDLRGRIELLIMICAAVQHAHQKGVIHQDLKPSNILVADIDGEPQPKIIDFGVARAVFGPQSAAALVEEFTGSPGYMSPEQADASLGDIDTRSDIYSLGAILHELLTDRTPLDIGARPLPLSEVQYLLHTRMPQPPSQRIAERADDEHAATCGFGSARALRREVRGELDWITLKALDREPARRYATAADFAADLQRFLARQPVSAARPSRLYALRKLAERHTAAVSIAAMLATMLVAFTAYSGWQAYELGKERDYANRETRKANEITEFMVNLFALGDPQSGFGRDITVRNAVDIGLARIETELADQPKVQAELMYSIARVYSGIGLFDRAEAVLSRALEKLAGDGDADIGRLLLAKGDAVRQLERFEDANRIYRDALAVFLERDGGESPRTQQARFGIAETLRVQGNVIDSVRMFNEIARSLEQLGAKDGLLYAQASVYIAENDYYLGELERAERTLRTALITLVSMRGEASREVVEARGLLIHVLTRLKKFDEAAQIAERNLKVLLETYGSDDEAAASAYTSLGLLMYEMQRLPEAKRYLNDALRIIEATRGKDSHKSITALNNLVTVHLLSGEYAEAAVLARQLYERSRQYLGEEAVDTADALLSLGYALSMTGSPAAGLVHIERAAPVFLKHHGEDTWVAGMVHEARGVAFMQLARRNEARAEFEKARIAYARIIDSDPSWTQRVEHHLDALE